MRPFFKSILSGLSADPCHAYQAPAIASILLTCRVTAPRLHAETELTKCLGVLRSEVNDPLPQNGR